MPRFVLDNQAVIAIPGEERLIERVAIGYVYCYAWESLEDEEVFLM